MGLLWIFKLSIFLNIIMKSHIFIERNCNYLQVLLKKSRPCFWKTVYNNSFTISVSVLLWSIVREIMNFYVCLRTERLFFPCVNCTSARVFIILEFISCRAWVSHYICRVNGKSAGVFLYKGWASIQITSWVCASCLFTLWLLSTGWKLNRKIRQ